VAAPEAKVCEPGAFRSGLKADTDGVTRVAAEVVTVGMAGLVSGFGANGSSVTWG